MRRKRITTPKGQLSLWDELNAPADALPGAPVLAEPKRRPAPAGPARSAGRARRDGTVITIGGWLWCSACRAGTMG